MITFEYRALQTDGGMSQGTIEAEGRHDAMQKMSAKGLKPVSLSERKGAAAAKAENDASGSFKLDFGPRKITARMLEDFTRLLSSLLSAGIPLSRALVILFREAPSPAAKQKWKEVHDLVIDGLPLADAMAKSPDVFPRVYVAMVQAGEAGGFLDLVLNQIADFQARDKELRSKMLSAMLYPVILLVLAIGVLIFLMVFFIPQFQKIFSGFGAELPMITQIIVGVSHIIRSYGLIVAAVVMVAVFWIRNWFKTPQGSRFWENALLRSPIAGSLVAKFAMSRFCRMLGTLLAAGVPLISGLQVARKSLGNQILVDAVSESIERVQKGEPLGASLAGCKTLFSGAVLEMIAVAEETGKLDQELVRLANVTESDLDRQLKTAVAFAEPLMLFFIAAFIGTIFIGMVIPIFTMQDYIK
jgi:type II secretory pathway component PulF